MPYYDFYYSFPFDAESIEMISGVLGSLSSIGWIIGLAVYVMRALGLYTVAKRRELRNPWLAWIPVGFEWMLGSVSDQYQYLVKARDTSRRKLMMGFSIAYYLAIFAASVIAIAVGVRLVISAAMMTESQIAEFVMWPLMIVIGAAVAVLLAGIALLVTRFVSLYDLYRSCQPDTAVLFLVLGILVSGLDGVFLMICRNKDEGMPPRRPQPVYVSPEQYGYESPEPVEEVPQEPWTTEE